MYFLNDLSKHPEIARQSNIQFGEANSKLLQIAYHKLNKVYSTLLNYKIYSYTSTLEVSEE